MKSPGTKTTQVLAIAATPLAIVALGASVYQASSAAFTGQTRNSGNEWATGSVKLTDDDNGAARFRVTNMLPGDTQTKCIVVTADASVPSTVKGYAINPVTSTAGLENKVLVTIDSGTGGSFADCNGFTAVGAPHVTNAPLSAIAQVNTFESGFGGWSVPAGVSSRTYRLTWKFDTTGMTQAQVDQMQGARTGIDMQWEMQSN
ncbi:hypothetical protein HN031_00675 [Nocardioides sp. zg-1308]|uniref:hypothetical protein n=1 Tax=Nocardioides TaxID=1839 RepID=UPI001556C4C0|nr:MULTISPECIES: hypothetical protein [unclassified Nocardioides]NPD03203.1 hypothetical protein [Nocardioides sp. zg-1308]WQQ21096.1 hypothetical protein SHK17_14445 [Nocardioides sp. S-34]